MRFEDFRAELDRDKAQQREGARQRRIRAGGPEWTADDLTVGELREILATTPD